MDIAAVQAAPTTAPWLLLGAVLAVVLLGLAGLVAVLVLRRPPGGGPEPRPDDPAPSAGTTDDLPGFLEHPPGSPGSPSPAAAGWPVLSAAPPVEPPPAPLPEPSGPERSRRQTGLALAALSVTALLLVGVAAALAVAAQPSRTDPEATAAPAGDTDPAPSSTAPSQPGALATSSVTPGRNGTEARLTLGGIVLERRAVGVTATYPRFEVTSDGEHAVAHVELPTFNCLTDHAPADPVAAGCLRSLTEYGDLTTPELEVSRDGDRVRVSGRFPTYLRPNGTPPAWTGRVYELTISAEPRAGDPDEGPVPATGVLELGPDRTETTGDDGNEIGFGP